MSYRNVSLSVACVFLSLCITLVLIPDVVYWLFGLEGNELGDFLAKRAGVLFFGFAVLCFGFRNSADKQVQSTVAVVVGTSMGLMALLGIFELVRGNSNFGILLAVFVEGAIAFLFLRFRSP